MGDPIVNPDSLPNDGRIGPRHSRHERPSDREIRGASSPGIERGFCKRCGSTLFWDAVGNPESFSIALGTPDGDPGVRPSLHIFVGSNAPWHEIADDLPRHETSPRAAVTKSA